MSGISARRLALVFVAASAIWSSQLATSWAFDSARYPFEDAVEYPTPLLNIQSADLTNDGHLDLIGVSGSALIVMPGNGDGSFGVPAVLQRQVAPGSGYIAPGDGTYVLGDANGDGVTDIAVERPSSSGGNEIAVLVNRGSGLDFDTTDQISVPTYVSLKALAPFGADSVADLLTVDMRDFRTNPTGTISVLPGAGDGTFGPPIDSAIGFTPPDSPYYWQPGSVATGDLDGDGIRDVVVGLMLVLQGRDSLVLRGRADGTFEPVATLARAGAYATSIADLNHDGLPDIVSVDAGTSIVGTYFYNEGGFQFTPYQYVPNDGWLMAPLAIADFDQDGNPDIAVPSKRFEPIGISYGLKGGGMLPIDGHPSVSDGKYVSLRHNGATTGDFNEDGLPDVVVGGYGQNVGQSLGGVAALLHKPLQPPDQSGGGGVLADVSDSGTGLDVIKHHFPSSIEKLLSRGVTATLTCRVDCDLRARLVAGDKSVEAFQLHSATFARNRATVPAARVVRVRVKPTGAAAKLLAAGAAAGKSLGYKLLFDSTPAT